MLDLKPFCGNNDIRHYLNSPFSEGQYTYATNGHILIRVPRREDVPVVEENGLKNKIPKMLADNPFVAAVPIPDIPPMEEATCDCCEGEGDHERMCGSSDTYPCAECNATGRAMKEPGNQRYPQIAVGDGCFAPRYLRLIKTLPAYQFSPNGLLMAAFRYRGGDGLLMQIWKSCEKEGR